MRANIILALILISSAAFALSVENVTVYTLPYRQNTSSETLYCGYNGVGSITNVTDMRLNGNSLQGAYLTFDRNFTQNTNFLMTDYSSYNNTVWANQTAAKNLTWVQSCMVGGCIDFINGGWMEIKNSTSTNINSTGSYTVSFWYYSTNASADWSYFIEKGKDTGVEATNTIGILQLTNTLGFYFGNGTTYYPLTGNAVVNNAWYHVLVTYDYPTNTATIYFNNTVKQTHTLYPGSPYPSNSSWFFGGNSAAQSRKLPLKIDEFMYFPRVLTLDERTALYNAGLAGQSWSIIPQSDLVNGQNWSCAVTPVNLTDSGTTVLSSNLTIAPITKGAVGDYYVSTTGDDTNTGTLASPFKTIGFAAMKAPSGSNVTVLNGVYNNEIGFIPIDSNIVLRANQTGAVLVILNQTNPTYVIRVSGTTNVSISGFNFTGTNLAGTVNATSIISLASDANGVAISNNILQNATNGVYMESNTGPNNTIISNNVFVNNANAQIYLNGPNQNTLITNNTFNLTMRSVLLLTRGIEMSSTSAVAGTGLSITNNSFWSSNLSYYGIYLVPNWKLSNFVIANNSFGTDQGSNTSFDACQAMFITNASDYRVTQNKFFLQSKLDGGALSCIAQPFAVQITRGNNISVDHNQFGSSNFLMYGFNSSYAPTGVSMYYVNNSVIDSNTYYTNHSSYMAMFYGTIGEPVYNNTISNNWGRERSNNAVGYYDIGGENCYYQIRAYNSNIFNNYLYVDREGETGPLHGMLVVNTQNSHIWNNTLNGSTLGFVIKLGLNAVVENNTADRNGQWTFYDKASINTTWKNLQTGPSVAGTQIIYISDAQGCNSDNSTGGVWSNITWTNLTGTPIYINSNSSVTFLDTMTGYDPASATIATGSPATIMERKWTYTAQVNYSNGLPFTGTLYINNTAIPIVAGRTSGYVLREYIRENAVRTNDSNYNISVRNAAGYTLNNHSWKANTTATDVIMLNYSEPVVTIISPADSSTITGASIIVLYTISSPELQSCWGVLDGLTLSLPSCANVSTPAIRTGGAHTLIIYANDTAGGVGSATSVFTEQVVSSSANIVMVVIAITVAAVLILIILQMDVSIENLVACMVIAIIVIQVIIPYLLNA